MFYVFFILFFILSMFIYFVGPQFIWTKRIRGFFDPCDFSERANERTSGTRRSILRCGVLLMGGREREPFEARVRYSQRTEIGIGALILLLFFYCCLAVLYEFLSNHRENAIGVSPCFHLCENGLYG